MKKILILDFGSQYTQLIARRVRELRVYSEVQPYNYDLEKIKADSDVAAIILSGGPSSVYDDNAPIISKEIFDLKVPILGICYGMQLMTQLLNGKVEPSKHREYGRAEIEILDHSDLFYGLNSKSWVWASHGDKVIQTAPDFSTIASSHNSPFSAVKHNFKPWYGVQFHPEVVHSVDGKQIIENFLFEICKLKEDWNYGTFIEETIQDIRRKVGQDRVLCALSGGVDSSVVARLIHRAVGDQLTCVFVDTGVLRLNEANDLKKIFKEHFHMNFVMVDSSETFLTNLSGVTNPEEKRKIIGHTFIDVFAAEANKYGPFKFLAQGTLYPDVIESIAVAGPSATIKSHHNVGGLPEKLGFELLEPVRNLFKDEVRVVGRELGLPEKIVHRHPFPGPGLAIRILGEVTKQKLDILRQADHIYMEELNKNGLYDRIWQAGAILLPIHSVGVMGDERSYDQVLALRAVNSLDGMTADWFRFEGEFLAHLSNRLINEVKGINRVVYDISSKPPATIEWE
ncbi:MAG: glutamine-hydrolyzing GMP synthase [Patescibacteria group bacterium]